MDESSTHHYSHLNGKRTLGLISNSARACFQQCARKYEYEHIKRSVPRHTALPLTIGSVFHAGVEAMHTGQPWQDAVARACYEHGLDDAYERAKVEAMLACYEARYADDVLKFIAVEKRLDAPVVNPATGKKSRTWVFVGRCDGVVE